jgi:hypothetical protein
VLLVALFAALQNPLAASPSPTATPRPRFALHASGSNVFIDQATAGPGTTPPEAAGFKAGLPLSPMSPYDYFSSAPVTPGVSGIAQYELTGTLRTAGADYSATLGIGGLTGSVTNDAYWGEPFIANLDIHDLSRVVPYSIAFPTHAGQDDASAFGASLLGASVNAPDGSWRVRGGYFDLLQTDRFVFTPPALTSVTPSLGPTVAETLGPGMPSIDAWPSSPTALPLLGADAYARDGSGSFELTDALLPSLANTSTRLTMGSFCDDRGAFGRYSIQIANVRTSGDPILTTTYFGIDPVVYHTPQGRLFTSLLQNQVETIGGIRALVHPVRHWDVLAELGRAWYATGLASHPGTSQPGNYEHFGLSRHFGDGTATIEYHRFDPTYATIVLPYGIPENVWSVAWSWPGVWLKSTYQVVDNSVVGANREGFHFRYDRPGTPIEFHAEYGDWRQIVPETFANAARIGFVDGFFLLQKNAYPTFGHDRQLGLYVAWHLARDDVAFDGVEDVLNRAAAPGQAVDTVAIRAPQFVVSWSHHFSGSLLAAGGYGRYEAIGTWATTPVDAVYGMVFAGVQFATGLHTALLVEARRYGLVGLPSAPGGLPPTLRGTQLVVDQRVSL